MGDSHGCCTEPECIFEPRNSQEWFDATEQLGKLRDQIISDRRAFTLIWDSPDGQVVTGITGKIDATEGLISRIKSNNKKFIDLRKRIEDGEFN
jgi:hypothetical protein